MPLKREVKEWVCSKCRKNIFTEGSVKFVRVKLQPLHGVLKAKPDFMVQFDNCTTNDWSFDGIVKIRPPVLSHCEHVTHVKCFLKHVQSSLEYKRSNPKTGLRDVEIKCPAAFCKVKFRDIEDVQVKPRSSFQFLPHECVTYQHQQSGLMTLTNTPVWSEDPINRGQRKLAKITCVVPSEIDEEANEPFWKSEKPLTPSLMGENEKLQKSAKEGKRLYDEQGGNANNITLPDGTMVEFRKSATDKNICFVEHKNLNRAEKEHLGAECENIEELATSDKMPNPHGTNVPGCSKTMYGGHGEILPPTLHVNSNDDNLLFHFNKLVADVLNSDLTAGRSEAVPVSMELDGSFDSGFSLNQGDIVETFLSTLEDSIKTSPEEYGLGAYSKPVNFIGNSDTEIND